MFDVGGGELLLIVLAVIVLFGPQKLPEIARIFSKGMTKLRDAQSQFNAQMNTIKTEINKSVNPEREFAEEYYRTRETRAKQSAGSDGGSPDVPPSPLQEQTTVETGNVSTDGKQNEQENNPNLNDPYGLGDESPAG